MWPSDEGWQLAEKYGQPDIVVKSAPYTVPAVAQDAWWKPLSEELPVTEQRWVRAVEMRPGTTAGRRVTHHALAQLLQDEPGVSSAADDDGIGPQAQARRNDGGLLMEWAIGKQFDVYPSSTGKLLLPGSRIRWEVHYHAVGEQIRDNVELGIYLYPKGEVPKYRTRLMEFHASQLGRVLDIPPNTVTENQAFHVLKVGCPAGEFSAAHASARQGHVHGSHLAGRYDANDQLCRSLPVQLDEQLYLCRGRSTGASQGHSAAHHCLA